MVCCFLPCCIYCPHTTAFILVYDITSSSSFDDLQPIYERLLRAKDCDEATAAARIPIVLVGNKCDLEVRFWGIIVFYYMHFFSEIECFEINVTDAMRILSFSFCFFVCACLRASGLLCVCFHFV